MFASDEKRSDVVLIISDIIFSTSDIVFPMSHVVFGECGKQKPGLYVDISWGGFCQGFFE